MKNEKPTNLKNLGLSAIVLSFVFLFNPNLNIIDFLPDFIGYIILFAALSRLSDMSEDIAAARKRLGYMVAVDIAKIATIFVAFGAPSADERNTMLLLFSFTFAVIELILLIPAIKSLFGGLINLGYKFENTSVLGSKRGRKNFSEKMCSATVFFVIFKAAMYTLPEFTVLSTHSYDESSRVVYIYEFVGLLRSFALIAATVCGIIWLARSVIYFSRVRKDKVFMNALKEDYTKNVLPRESLFVRKTVRLVSLLFCAAALLCFDFRVEYFNLIPDLIAAAVLIAAAIAAKKHIPKFAKYFAPFLAYAVISFGATLIEYNFFGEYFYSAIGRNDEAYNAYCVMLASSLFDAAAFVLAVVGMAYMLRYVIEHHTGFSVPGVSLNVEDKIKRVQSELKKKLFVFYVGAFLCFASDVFYDFGARTVNFAGFVNGVCVLVFFGTVYYVTEAIKDEVESKYMLE